MDVGLYIFELSEVSISYNSINQKNRMLFAFYVMFVVSDNGFEWTKYVATLLIEVLLSLKTLIEPLDFIDSQN